MTMSVESMGCRGLLWKVSSPESVRFKVGLNHVPARQTWTGGAGLRWNLTLSCSHRHETNGRTEVGIADLDSKFVGRQASLGSRANYSRGPSNAQYLEVHVLA